MKAERRHELKENSLVHGVKHFPEYWRDHGSKVMLGLIAVLLVIALLRWRHSAQEDKANRVGGGLSYAQSQLTKLNTSRWDMLSNIPEQFSNLRKTLQASVEEQVRIVLSESDDPAQQAEAKVIRGDLYWSLSQLGELTQATTQPMLRMEKRPVELIEMATKDYEDVLKNSNALPANIVSRARLGLAAIAENRSDFTNARTQYEAVAKADALPEALRDETRKRMTKLADLEKPVLWGHPMKEQTPESMVPPTPENEFAPLGPAFAPTTKSSTAPSSAIPMTGPSSMPAMVPAGTRPTSAPATLPVVP